MYRICQYMCTNHYESWKWISGRGCVCVCVCVCTDNQNFHIVFFQMPLKIEIRAMWRCDDKLVCCSTNILLLSLFYLTRCASRSFSLSLFFPFSLSIYIFFTQKYRQVSTNEQNWVMSAIYTSIRYCFTASIVWKERQREKSALFTHMFIWCLIQYRNAIRHFFIGWLILLCALKFREMMINIGNLLLMYDKKVGILKTLNDQFGAIACAPFVLKDTLYECRSINFYLDTTISQKYKEKSICMYDMGLAVLISINCAKMCFTCQRTNQTICNFWGRDRPGSVPFWFSFKFIFKYMANVLELNSRLCSHAHWPLLKSSYIYSATLNFIIYINVLMLYISLTIYAQQL